MGASATGASRQIATGASTNQEPVVVTKAKWAKDDPRRGLMQKQFWPFILPVMVSGAANITDFVIAGLEMNGKRIWTVDNHLYWRVCIAGLQTLWTILVIYLSIFGIRKGKYNLYDHQHYSPFMSYVTVVWLCNITTYGLIQTFWYYATQAQIDLWNDFSIARYAGVSLEYQSLKSTMYVIYMAVFVSAVASFIMAAFVFKAWMYPQPSAAVLNGKVGGDKPKRKARDEDEEETADVSGEDITHTR